MRIPTAVISTAVLVSTLAVAEEKKIQRSDLPTPVEKAVAAQSEGAAIKGFSVENEDDHTYYEVEMTVSGHS